MGDLFGSDKKKKKNQQAAPPAPPPIPAAVSTVPMAAAAIPVAGGQVAGAPQATMEGQASAEAEAKRSQASMGRRSTILNKKGVLGLASEFASIKKSKLGG